MSYQKTPTQTLFCVSVIDGPKEENHTNTLTIKDKKKQETVKPTQKKNGDTSFFLLH